MQNNIEDVVKKSTQIWKVTYGLSTIKKGEPEPIEVNDENDDKDDDEKNNIVGGGEKMEVDDMATTEPKQLEE